MKSITHDKLVKRVLQLSKKHKLSHIGSCVSVLPILMDIYEQKKQGDKVVFSNAHAHLAHLVVQEAYDGLEDIEKLLEDYGIHCTIRAGCDASGGSLGHGGGISIGLALANKKSTVYWIVSDGSLAEGSEWEAMRIAEELQLKNLQMYCNFNGFSATKKIELGKLSERVKLFFPEANIYYTDNGEGLHSIEGHYKQL